jgi:hypothetical protein
MVNMTGAVLGGMVDQQNKVAEQQARNRQLDIAQQGADTQRMGVANQQLQFGQRLALERMNATLEQMRQIKANLQSPADMPRVAGTMQELAKDVVLLAQAGGFDPQAAINQVQAVMAGTQTVSEAAQNKGTATSIETNLATPALAGLAGAQEAARAQNAAPQVIASVSDKGHQVVTLLRNGTVTKQMDLGAVKDNVDLGKFRVNLALRSQNKDVDMPGVQSLTPSEALAVSNVLATANPINSFIGSVLGGNSPAAGGAPSPNDALVSSYFSRIAKGGQLSGAEWSGLNPAEKSDLQSLVGNLKQPAPAASAPPINPLSNLTNPAPPTMPMAP